MIPPPRRGTGKNQRFLANMRVGGKPEPVENRAQAMAFYAAARRMGWKIAVRNFSDGTIKMWRVK